MRKVLFVTTLLLCFTFSTKVFAADYTYYGHSDVVIYPSGLIEVFCDPPMNTICAIVFVNENSTYIRIFQAGSEGYVEYTADPNTDVVLDENNNSIRFWPAN